MTILHEDTIADYRVRIVGEPDARGVGLLLHGFSAETNRWYYARFYWWSWKDRPEIEYLCSATCATQGYARYGGGIYNALFGTFENRLRRELGKLKRQLERFRRQLQQAERSTVIGSVAVQRMAGTDLNLPELAAELPDYSQRELEALREVETAIENAVAGGEQQ